jgi:hypothetical protein
MQNFSRFHKTTENSCRLHKITGAPHCWLDFEVQASTQLSRAWGGCHAASSVLAFVLAHMRQSSVQDPSLPEACTVCALHTQVQAEDPLLLCHASTTQWSQKGFVFLRRKTLLMPYKTPVHTRKLSQGLCTPREGTPPTSAVMFLFRVLNGMRANSISTCRVEGRNSKTLAYEQDGAHGLPIKPVI